MFSDITAAQRVLKDHPLYSHTGRPSIPPERLLRALLLQVLYSTHSERMLMEHLDDHLLFRWWSACSARTRGWLKTVGMTTKLRHRGFPRAGWSFTFALAANKLVRIRNRSPGAGVKRAPKDSG